MPALRSLPASSTEGQPLGIAKLEGFSPTDNVRALAGVVAAAVGGSILFGWVQRRAWWGWTQYRLAWAGSAAGLLVSADGATVPAILLTTVLWLSVGFLVEARRIDRPGSRDVALAFAHAMIAWVFLTPEFGSFLGSPSTLGLVLLPLSLLTTAFLNRRATDQSSGHLAAAVAIAPFALIRTWSADVRLAGAVAAYVLPLVAGYFLRRPSQRVILTRVASYGLLPGALLVLTAAAFLRETYVGDLFEDGHGLLPAAEYARGSLPYADVVPGHGLITDGLMQLASLRFFGDSYVGLRTGDRALGLFFWPLVYFLGLAATGRPHLAFASALLLLSLFPQFYFLRIIFALGTLTIVFSALRQRRVWLWFLAGAAAVAGILFAVEFGAYTAFGACAAVLVSRGSRFRNIRALLAGILVASGALATAFGRLGILSGFLETTLRHLPELLPAYAGHMPQPPLSPGASPFHAGATQQSSTEITLFYVLLLGALLVVGLVISQARALGRSGRPLMVIAVWYVVATLSVVERSHANYVLFLAPLGITLTYLWTYSALEIGTRRFLLLAFFMLGLIVLRPFSICRGFALRLGKLEIPMTFQPVNQPVRAGGVLFKERDAHTVEMMGRALAEVRLHPDQTWFDFANLPALYYLFDRDCPVRYYEVPFFQDPARQREVIAALEVNPNVRLALLPISGSTAYAIDGIPNESRAQVVFQYLRANFRPLFVDRELQVWIRD